MMEGLLAAVRIVRTPLWLLLFEAAAALAVIVVVVVLLVVQLLRSRRPK